MADTTDRRLSASEKADLPENLTFGNIMLYAFDKKPIPQEGPVSSATSTGNALPGSVSKSVTSSGTNSVQTAPLKLTAPTDITKPEVISNRLHNLLCRLLEQSCLKEIPRLPMTC